MCSRGTCILAGNRVAVGRALGLGIEECAAFKAAKALASSRDRVAVGRALGLGIKECATFKVCEHVRGVF